MDNKKRESITFYMIMGSIILISVLILPSFWISKGGPYSPFEDPPFYLLTIQLKKSIPALFGLIVGLIAVYYRFPSNKLQALSAFAVIVLFLGIEVISGISILFNTNDVWNPELARSNWSTREEFRGSAWNKYGKWIYMLASVLVIRPYFKKYKAEEESKPT